MTVAIAIFNRKGGSGKTSVTINLGGALAELGNSVLLVDTDDQANLTEWTGFAKSVARSEGLNIVGLLENEDSEPDEVIQPAPHDAFDVLPGHKDMAMAERTLAGEGDGARRLERVLQRLRREYDFILVDCPPELSTVTDNALVACRRVLIPSYMHSKVSSAIDDLFDQMEVVERFFHVEIDTVGIVPVALEKHTNQLAFRDRLHKRAPEYMAPALRKRTSLIDAAAAAGHSIFSHHTSGHLKRAQGECQADYLALANFVIEQTERQYS